MITLTETPLDAAARTGRRIAALAALLFAVCLFWTVASVNVPRDASDAELLAWWGERPNRTAGLISAGFAVATAVFFVVLLNHLRTLTPAAPRWTAFGHTMGTAFVAAILVTSAPRGAIGYLVDHLHPDAGAPSIDVLRYTQAFGYVLLDLPVMVTLGATMVAFSIVVLRTGALGRWVGYVGLACSAVIAGAVVLLVGAFAIPAALLWAVCLAVAILRAEQ